MCREIDGDRAAERVTVDESQRRIGLELCEAIPSRARVLVDRLLRRQIAIAFAEAAIIDRQHRKTESMQLFDAIGLACKIPARAVQIQDGRRVLRRSGPPPRVDALRLAVRFDSEICLLDTLRQAVEPARGARDDAEGQLPLFFRQLAAARDHEQGDRRRPRKEA